MLCTIGIRHCPFLRTDYSLPVRAWKFFTQFGLRKLSPSPQSSPLKLCAAIASLPRAKIGQALSPYESALVLINNVVTSETKAAKKELFISTLHALTLNILRVASCLRRKSFLWGSWEKGQAEVSFGKSFVCAVWYPYLKNEHDRNEEGIYPLLWRFKSHSP